jgi:L-ascorbate metabolism protein UlaG (beta-lactamase superfamily)
MAELTWHGHACFRLRGRDAVILLDPVGRHLGSDISRLRPDIVTISHRHPGHSNVEGLKGTFTILDGPGEYEIKDVFITGVRTYHDDEKGARFGHNTVFVIQLEDMVFCHLGDLGHTLSSDQLEQIGDVDVLMVPAGGVSLSPANAVEVISQIEPGLVVPMHYATGQPDAGAATVPPTLDTLERFSREMGLHDLAVRDKLTVRKSDIPEQMQVVVLSDQRNA